MLILTRKSGQSFQIGEDIKVTITEISGDKVKIGIEAPREMRVLREELGRTMESNRQAAAGVSEDTLRALAAKLSPAAQMHGAESPVGKLAHMLHGEAGSNGGGTK